MARSRSLELSDDLAQLAAELLMALVQTSEPITVDDSAELGIEGDTSGQMDSLTHAVEIVLDHDLSEPFNGLFTNCDGFVAFWWHAAERSQPYGKYLSSYGILRGEP